MIEDEIIEIKDSFIENGFKEGIKTAIDSAVNLGKTTQQESHSGKLMNISTSID